MPWFTWIKLNWIECFIAYEQMVSVIISFCLFCKNIMDGNDIRKWLILNLKIFLGLVPHFLNPNAVKGGITMTINEECMCRLRNIAMRVWQTDRQTDGQTDGHTDWRWTKWSLCVAMLRRRHNKLSIAIIIYPFDILSMPVFYTWMKNVHLFSFWKFWITPPYNAATAWKVLVKDR